MKRLAKYGLVMIILTIVLGVGQLFSKSCDRSINKKYQGEKHMGKMVDTATFAGGCFWCIEAAFEKTVDVEAVSGYTGGHVENPSYEQVTAGTTGHYEAVQLKFDPEKVSYEQLLDILFRQIDPTDDSGSFADRGVQYRSAVFYHNNQQRDQARAFIEQIDRSGRFDKPVATRVIPFETFYEAETYHQDYHNKNPIRYKFYRLGSGRDKFIETRWNMDPHGKSFSGEELKKRLTPLQFHVTQEEGTEPAFNNEYWDNKARGIYVDIVSNEPLFSSTDKFESGTGWPSFTRPIHNRALVEKQDNSLFMTRIEVRSGKADSHLGHRFNDGPEPRGLRYCINSAALKFVPMQDLSERGLEKYLPLFD